MGFEKLILIKNKSDALCHAIIEEWFPQRSIYISEFLNIRSFATVYSPCR